MNGFSIEATGNGEIKMYIDDEKKAVGSVMLNEGHITASSFQGSAGKHEVKLQFSKVNDLEIHRLCFR